MSGSPEPVTVLVTNHHVLHNLSEAIDATYEFSYLRQDSPHTPDPIQGVDLIPQNARGFNTCKETEGVRNILRSCFSLDFFKCATIG